MEVCSQPFPVLTTPRLILRDLRSTDGPALFELRNNEQVNTYLDRPSHHTVEETQQFISRIINNVSKNESLYWVITLRDNDRPAGTISLWNISQEDNSIEIGYELHPSHQGKGLMQEALAVVIPYVMDVIKAGTINAFIHTGNAPSIHLMIKNNFVRNLDLETRHQEDLVNMHAYSLTRP